MSNKKRKNQPIDTLRTAYAKGRSDFYSGTRKANPYPNGSALFDAWDKGYCEESAAHRQKFLYREKL